MMKIMKKYLYLVGGNGREMKEHIKGIKNLHIVSDGCRKHFKSAKTIAYVLTKWPNELVRQGFDKMNITYDFTASMHGKGPADGAAAVLKAHQRNAAKEGIFLGTADAIADQLNGKVSISSLNPAEMEQLRTYSMPDISFMHHFKASYDKETGIYTIIGELHTPSDEYRNPKKKEWEVKPRVVKAKCGNCGEIGHTMPTCPKIPCKKCDVTGHLTRDCLISKKQYSNTAAVKKELKNVEKYKRMKDLQGEVNET